VSVHGLGWLGVRTDRFGQTVALYRDVLGLEPFRFLTEADRDGGAAWCRGGRS
jgi:hypothetical protein